MSIQFSRNANSIVELHRTKTLHFIATHRHTYELYLFVKAVTFVSMDDVDILEISILQHIHTLNLFEKKLTDSSGM